MTMFCFLSLRYDFEVGLCKRKHATIFLSHVKEIPVSSPHCIILLISLTRLYILYVILAIEDGSLLIGHFKIERVVTRKFNNVFLSVV